MNRPPDRGHLASVVDRNIEALLAQRLDQDRRRGLQERAADGIARFTGSMPFVYIHLAIFGAWIVVNLGWVPGIRPFDPAFTVLAMAASVEAIFLSTFVLINQNRMQALADRRADLDLQISLLGEHEITRLIQLVRDMARRMGVEQADHPELQELSRDVAPEKVMDRIDEHEENRRAGESASPSRR